MEKTHHTATDLHLLHAVMKACCGWKGDWSAGKAVDGGSVWLSLTFRCYKNEDSQILAYGTSLSLKVIGILRLQEISTMDKGIADGQ